ncbi:MAG: dienelactone hydrolase family protein [Acidobacteriaceae bacterium]|nr:dienelactone hydrolase family protein [Acidobacteriaceae bacterium]
MSEYVQLKAEDGNQLSAYVARPAVAPVAALVIVQEIYGINAHIRSVADGYATAGFLAIAPALFDRIEHKPAPGVELDYSGEGAKKATEFYGKLNVDLALLDIAAAFKWAQQSVAHIGVVGFCYGGLMAWLSATRLKNLGLEPSAAVGYYAGGIGKFAQEKPTCPVMLHFGEKDDHIGADQREAVAKAHPDVIIYTYPEAGHAFNRDVDPTKYNAAAAKLALERSLAFLKKNVAS